MISKGLFRALGFGKGTAKLGAIGEWKRGFVHNMKTNQKAASIRKAALLFLCIFFFSGCADVKGPQWLTGEPEEDVLKAPSVIERPNEKEKSTAWPSVGDAPQRPRKTYTAEDRQKVMDGMEADSKAAMTVGERLEKEAQDAWKTEP